MSQRTGRVAVAYSVRLVFGVFSSHTSQWTPLIVALPAGEEACGSRGLQLPTTTTNQSTTGIFTRLHRW
jgi:hypothetical protein